MEEGRRKSGGISHHSNPETRGTRRRVSDTFLGIFRGSGRDADFQAPDDSEMPSTIETKPTGQSETFKSPMFETSTSKSSTAAVLSSPELVKSFAAFQRALAKMQTSDEQPSTESRKTTESAQGVIEQVPIPSTETATTMAAIGNRFAGVKKVLPVEVQNGSEQDSRTSRDVKEIESKTAGKGITQGEKPSMSEEQSPLTENDSSRENKSERKSVEPDVKLAPSALVDGTKLILNLAAHQQFQVDNCLKVIFSSSPLRRVERGLTFATYTVDIAETIVVIDSCMTNQTFIPIAPALYGGAIYTRDGAAHVIVPGAGDIKRSKVSAKTIPCKMANKFVAHMVLHPQPQILMPRNPRTGPIRKPWSPLISNMTESASAAGVVFIRVDPSIFRYPLVPFPKSPQPDETAAPGTEVASPLGAKSSAAETGRETTSPAFASTSQSGGANPQISMHPHAVLPPRTQQSASVFAQQLASCEFHDGRVVAWSGNVEFKFQVSFYCCKKVTGANVAKGTVWIDNPKQATSNPQTFTA